MTDQAISKDNFMSLLSWAQEIVTSFLKSNKTKY